MVDKVGIVLKVGVVRIIYLFPTVEGAETFVIVGVIEMFGKVGYVKLFGVV